MEQKIIDQRVLFTENGVICILSPADCGMTLKEIADKDVPTGIKYKCCHISDIPTERIFRGAWEADYDGHDGVGK